MAWWKKSPEYKKKSKPMAKKPLWLIPSIYKHYKRLNWKATSSLSTKRKISKLKIDLSNNSNSMKTSDQIETPTVRVSQKQRMKSPNSKEGIK